MSLGWEFARALVWGAGVPLGFLIVGVLASVLGVFIKGGKR